MLRYIDYMTTPLSIRFDAEVLESFTCFGNELIGSLERYSSETVGPERARGGARAGADGEQTEHSSAGARKGAGNGKDAVRQGV